MGGSTSTQELINKAKSEPKTMTDREWKDLLSSLQYQVTRRHGTERAWSGRYNEEKGKVCLAVSAVEQSCSLASINMILGLVGHHSLIHTRYTLSWITFRYNSALLCHILYV